MSESPRHVNPWIVAVAVMFATFMEVLDTTVVNVSLPHIAGSLSATTDEATWALTSYLVANAIILPMTGWLASTVRPQAPADAVGRRLHGRVVPLRPGAEPARSLIVFRIIQGATGGALQPLSQAVLLEVVPARGSRQGDGLLGTRHRRRADSRPGARRLADRQLQLALGVLHQPAGRHRVDRHDAAVHLRSAVPAAASRRASTTGASACSPSASARCSSCSTRASRKTGSRRTLITDAGDRLAP